MTLTPNKQGNLLAIATLILTSLALSSCEQMDNLMGKLGGKDESGSSAPNAGASNGQNAGFAILDLNAIAQRTGRSQALQNALNARERQLTNQLVQMRTNMEKQYVQTSQQLGETPTEEQSNQLAGIAREMNQRLNQAQSAARDALTKDQATLIRTFRGEVLPIATTIASERGLNTILTKNDSVLFAWDPRNDITEEVIKRMATPMVP